MGKRCRHEGTFELFKTTLLSNPFGQIRLTGYVFELFKTTLLSNRKRKYKRS